MNNASGISKNSLGQWAILFFFLVGPVAGGSGLCAAETNKETRVDPLRTFQFNYQQTAVDQSIRDYLSFIHKVAPGLEEIGSQYAVADMFMDHERYEDASRLLKVLAESPTKDVYFRYSVLGRLATCLMHQSRYTEASGYYKVVVDGPVKALVPEAIIGLSLAILSAGDIPGAYQRFREVTALYPAYKTHPRYMLPMGLVQFQMRKYPSALDYFLRDDRNPGSQYFAGLCYQQLKRYPEASGTFRRITQEYPDSDWADRARFELGETFYLQEDFLLAAHTFEDIFLSHRSVQWDNLSLFRLACCDVRMKKFASAEQRLGALSGKKLEPSLAANVNYMLTESLAAQDKIGKIIRLLGKGSDKKRSLENSYRLIWARAAEGNYKKAVSLANDFLNQGEDPELTPRTLLLQAYAFERLGQWPEAFATYQLVAEHFSATPYAAKAAELSCANFYRAGEFKSISTQVSSLWRRVDPDIKKRFPETLYWMGHASMKLRDFAQAQKFFKEFVTIAPAGHPWLSEGLRAQALAFAMDKSVKEALPVLQRAYQSAQETGNTPLMAKLTMDTANILFNAGNKYEEAVSYYRRLAQIDPKNDQIPFALYQQALSLYRAEYYNEAAETWESLSVQYPRDGRAAESLFRASRTRFELGKYPEAIAGYQTLVRNFPQSPFVRDARFQIGQAYFNAKEWTKAIESYMDFQTRFPADPELAQVGNYIQLASYNSGMPVKEMEEKFRGKTKTPVLADVYWREGAKLFNNKEYDAARDNFQKILYEFPSSSWASQASFYRAESLFLQENFKEAAVAYETFLQGFPGNANTAPAQFHLGVSYFSVNNFYRSAVVFEEFQKTFPTDELAKSAMLNAAISYSRVGDVEKTTLAYLQYASLYPNADDVGASYIQLGQFLEKVGQESRALETYRRVPPKVPEYPQALYLLARLHKSLSEPAGERQAYLALQKVPAKSDPYRIAGLLALADIYLAANEADPALALYADVLKNASDDANRSLAQQQISAIRGAVGANP
ncbi:MAG: tetratricopeptide repeat protein [Elusimicrobia bacterium]|nr:tetratricopeptide repeat protein [Elusimicrobiota bacterium]